ncbi:MAG: von Willebrand factor type A domain-containing protein, partial [Verrucomicrobia bacterium]|nr:von Willebrand factor type A domain-containing protein [Verrucomicrobiota bacterium]
PFAATDEQEAEATPLVATGTSGYRETLEQLAEATSLGDTESLIAKNERPTLRAGRGLERGLETEPRRFNIDGSVTTSDESVRREFALLPAQSQLALQEPMADQPTDTTGPVIEQDHKQVAAADVSFELPGMPAPMAQTAGESADKLLLATAATEYGSVSDGLRDTDDAKDAPAAESESKPAEVEQRQKLGEVEVAQSLGGAQRGSTSGNEPNAPGIPELQVAQNDENGNPFDRLAGQQSSGTANSNEFFFARSERELVEQDTLTLSEQEASVELTPDFVEPAEDRLNETGDAIEVAGKPVVPRYDDEVLPDDYVMREKSIELGSGPDLATGKKSDGYSIELAVAPEVVEFDGFADRGGEAKEPEVRAEAERADVLWHTPRVESAEALAKAAAQPQSGEYQRGPGHPASTSLSSVIFPNESEPTVAAISNDRNGGLDGEMAGGGGPASVSGPGGEAKPGDIVEEQSSLVAGGTQSLDTKIPDSSDGSVNASAATDDGLRMFRAAVPGIEPNGPIGGMGGGGAETHAESPPAAAPLDGGEALVSDRAQSAPPAPVTAPLSGIVAGAEVAEATQVDAQLERKLEVKKQAMDENAPVVAFEGREVIEDLALADSGAAPDVDLLGTITDRVRERFGNDGTEVMPPAEPGQAGDDGITLREKNPGTMSSGAGFSSIDNFNGLIDNATTNFDSAGLGTAPDGAVLGEEGAGEPVDFAGGRIPESLVADDSGSLEQQKAKLSAFSRGGSVTTDFDTGLGNAPDGAAILQPEIEPRFGEQERVLEEARGEVAKDSLQSQRRMLQSADAQETASPGDALSAELADAQRQLNEFRTASLRKRIDLTLPKSAMSIEPHSSDDDKLNDATLEQLDALAADERRLEQRVEDAAQKVIEKQEHFGIVDNGGLLGGDTTETGSSRLPDQSLMSRLQAEQEVSTLETHLETLESLEGEKLIQESLALGVDGKDELRAKLQSAQQKLEALDATSESGADRYSELLNRYNSAINPLMKEYVTPVESIQLQEKLEKELLGNIQRERSELWQESGKEFAPVTTTEELASSNAFSTFSLNVSDVAFKLAQSALTKGEWPEPEKMRVEEFVNALDYGDPAPAVGEKVTCRTEQCAHPFMQQRNLLRIAMRTAAVGREGGQPLRLTILLDNSGSMQREDREASVRRAMEVLAAQLQQNDQVSLIGFARTPRLLADRVSGSDGAKLLAAVDDAPSEGGTNLEEAMRLAAEVAQRQYADGAVNRIVLMTDGAANLGNADPEQLATRVVELRQVGIAFDACGVGAKGLNDEVLEALTRKGDGRYYFLDAPEQADSGFASQLAGALRPAAKNVKVQVVFNPERVGAYRLIGYEKHRLKKEDFRNDAVDAAEMAAEETGVAVYQIEPMADGSGDVGEVRVRFQDVASGRMIEHSWIIPYEENAPTIDGAAPSVQLAGVAAMVGEYLRGGPDASNVDLDVLSSLAPGLRSAYGDNVRVNQLIGMIRDAQMAK